MTQEIKKEDIIQDVVEKHPDIAPVFFKFGMHCLGCPAARGESIESGAKAHGMDDEKVEELVKELNKAINNSEKEPKKE